MDYEMETFLKNALSHAHVLIFSGKKGFCFSFRQIHMMMSNLFSMYTCQVQVPDCSNPIMTLHIIILGILWLFREMLKDFVLRW